MYDSVMGLSVSPTSATKFFSWGDSLVPHSDVWCFFWLWISNPTRSNSRTKFVAMIQKCTHAVISFKNEKFLSNFPHTLFAFNIPEWVWVTSCNIFCLLLCLLLSYFRPRHHIILIMDFPLHLFKPRLIFLNVCDQNSDTLDLCLLGFAYWHSYCPTLLKIDDDWTFFKWTLLMIQSNFYSFFY